MNTAATQSMTDLFGDVIYAYTRAQAIEDGELVDVSEMAREAGFRFPVAISRAVWDAYVTVPAKVQLQDETGRLWDILWMASIAARRNRGGSRSTFGVHVRNDNRHGTPKLRTLALVCGPGDNAEPVLTIMLPEES